MYSLLLSRSEFLELTRRPAGPFPYAKQSRSFSANRSIANEEVLAIWGNLERQPTELPHVVMVNTEVEEDFLAWLTAYGQWLRPLTAYCRVVNNKDAAFFLKERNRERWQDETAAALANASAGLMLSEAYSYLNANDNLSQLPVIAAERTFSFVMARAAHIGDGQQESEESLFTKWRRTRDFSGFDVPEESGRSLQTAWGTLLSAFLGESLVLTDRLDLLDSEVVEFCRDIASKGEPSFSSWKHLVSPFSGLDDALEEMRGTREHRITVLERAQRVILESPSSMRGSVIFGYLASLISPGTLEHIDVVRRMSLRQTAPIYWYGLFAGLPRESKVMLEAGGLARRIMRDVERHHSIFDRPTCDIALNELEVMARLGDIENVIPVLRSGYVEVELAPGINTTIRMKKVARRKSADLFSSSLAEDQLTDIVPQLERVLGDLYSIYDRIKPQRDNLSDAKKPGETKTFRRQRK